MNRLYNVTIEYLGMKKQDKFPASTICLGKDGAFLVMDGDGQSVRFVAKDCRVEQIAANVIITRGYTDKPRHITAYCVYANIPIHVKADSATRATPQPEAATRVHAPDCAIALNGRHACSCMPTPEGSG